MEKERGERGREREGEREGERGRVREYCSITPVMKCLYFIHIHVHVHVQCTELTL